MKIYQGLTDFHPPKNAVVTSGTFDGVHLGHQSVIDLARQTAETISAPLGILTFEPHPRSYFAPQSPAFRLMSSEARATRLAKLDVDLLYELNFNTSLSSLTPREFAQNVIADGLGLSHLSSLRFLSSVVSVLLLPSQRLHVAPY